ncbi:MAG: glycosyltransferase [Gemmatimonadaceae bacterium]|nr:glycosyltransferase [Gemmatimonadaceae bacterium]
MPGTTASPKVAVVVDWLNQLGGAELVVREILATFPGATLYTLFDTMRPDDRARISSEPSVTSYLQKLPDIGTRYRSLLPVMVHAIGTLDLSSADVIISSHHSVAKGIRKHAGQFHLCYCHSPMRYAWDKREAYLEDHGIRGVKAAVARALLERIRTWDLTVADRVDRFVVNSRYVGDRVRRHYGRDFVVIHPPVDLEFFTPDRSIARDPNIYVTASRQVPYKRIDRIVEAFRTLPERRLVVIGDGPQHARLRELVADAPNISLLGELSREAMRDWFRRARAFVFAADEDFGIVPLEAQACGTPVIALGQGGALETVNGYEGPDRTGQYFPDDQPSTIAEAVRRFEALTIPPTAEACRANAERFDAMGFRTALRQEVEQGLAGLRSEM